MLRQFLEGLITEFDRAESDPRVALSLRRMQLPQSDDCLAFALLIDVMVVRNMPGSLSLSAP